jgi:hypothetical protein
MMLAQQVQRPDWFSFATTLVATLVGGLLALGTAVMVRRWELRQATRIRLYDELLPNVANIYHSWLKAHRGELGVQVSKEADDAATKLSRAAVIAGEREWLIAKPIRERMRQRSKASSLKQARDLDAAIEKQFDVLEAYLKKKMGLSESAHTLQHLDPVGRTAVCAVDGPVRVKRRMRLGRWHCVIELQEAREARRWQRSRDADRLARGLNRSPGPYPDFTPPPSIGTNQPEPPPE